MKTILHTSGALLVCLLLLCQSAFGVTITTSSYPPIPVVPATTPAIPAIAAFGGTTSGGGTYGSGAQVTLVAVPAMFSGGGAADWFFVSWTEGGTVVSTDATYQFTATVNRTLVANFQDNAARPFLVRRPNQVIKPTLQILDNVLISKTGSSATLTAYWIPFGQNRSGDYAEPKFGTGIDSVPDVNAVPYPIIPGPGKTQFDVFKVTKRFTGLSRNQSYSWRAVTGTGSAGLTTISDPTPFATDPTPPEIQTITAGSVTSSTGAITVDLIPNDNQDADSTTTNSAVVEYGLDTTYGTTSPAQSVPIVVDSNSGDNNAFDPARLVFNLSGLQPGMIYHYRIRANNPDTTASVENPTPAPPALSPDQTFTTLAAPVNYTIAVSASPANGGTTSGDGTFLSGSSQTVTATANTGFTFTNWTEGGTVVSTSGSYTFTVSGNRTLVANFVPVGTTYILTLNSMGDPDGTVVINPEGEIVSAPVGFLKRRFSAGAIVSLTPSTLRGYFARWSGDVSGNAVPLAVAMDRDKSVTAEFVPYSAVTGTYRGIITDAVGNPAGFAVATVSRLSKLTFTIHYRGQLFRSSGVLSDNGQSFSLSFLDPLTGQSIQLFFAFRGAAPAIAVEQEVGLIRSEAGTLTRPNLPFTTKNPPLQAGRYTVLLPVDPAQAGVPTYPQGSGYATLVVSPLGAVSVAGKVGDGSALSIRSAIDGDGLVPLYARPYKSPAGYLAGTLAFREVAGVSDANGSFRWHKPPQTRVQSYQSGFVGEVPAIAARFVPTGVVTNGDLTLSQGGLIQPLLRAVTVPARTGKVLQTPGGEKLALSFNATTGLFTGSFTPGSLANPADPRRRSIYGAVLLKSKLTGGLFTAPNGTGKFEIDLTP